MTWTSAPIRLGHKGARAKLVLRGVDQGGPSFEARVFLDNPRATITTPLDDACGYAGSFHVYGRGDGVRTPTDRELQIGPALAHTQGDTVVVTVVALLHGAHGPVDLGAHLSIASAAIYVSS